jgi:hypothetical protein
MRLITYTIFSLLLLLSFSSKAQNAFSVKGSVADTASASKLHNTSVLVLRAKDSIMVKFTRADQQGNFAISNLPEGKYLLLVTYPEYADYTEQFTLNAAAPTHNFGRISMLLKSRLLQELVVRSTPTPIKIKGDTTIFNASAYVVQPNAKVEDLIKQFPGIQVDKDGKITANGQTVAKMLVGGEEFFGDDPTLVTKNIRADMVKEVQMFEKKSDQAAFTGVDDGKKTLTMNVVLKDDKKNGYFGKIDAGAGNQDYYSGQAMYNKFQDKEKFSFNATLSNNGRTGLSFQDEQKFGDAGTVTVMDGGGIMITTGGNDLYYDRRGLPISRSGGLHYDNKWNKDKVTINTNYKIGQLEVAGEENAFLQNNLPNPLNTTPESNLPNFLNTTTSSEKFYREGFRQKLDAASVIQLDSSSNLKITLDGTIRRSTQRSEFNEFTYTDLGVIGQNKLLNDQARTTSTETDSRTINASAFYTKKMKKKGRTLSVLLSNANEDAKQEGYLLSNRKYYDTATGDVIDAETKNEDQFKPATTKSNTFNSNFTYTEPLSKSLSLVFNYGLNLSDAKADKLAYDRSASGEYDMFNTKFSNKFTLNQLAHQGGAIFNYVKGKTTLNFGTRATDVQQKQINEFNNDVFERHFINWMPQLTYQYRMGTQASFYVTYNGSTQQPTISQLQPLPDNTNPNYLVVGNRDLKPSFSNRFNFSYNFSKALTGTRFYISGGYSFTENAFVSNTATDNFGRTVSQQVNLFDKNLYNYSVNATYGRKIWGDITVQLSSGYNKGMAYNMVNNVSNSTKTEGYNARLTLQKYAAKKYEAYIYAGPTYNVRELSLSKQNSNTLDYSGDAYFTYFLPAKFQIASDASYTYQGKTQTLPAFSRTIVNASLSKMFLKDNTLKLTAAVNDLFNQYNGFNRNANGSQISQRTNTTIRRYFMLSVIWDFNKMGGGAPKN